MVPQEGVRHSYNNERGSHEPLLFVNGAAFGGDGSCDVVAGGNPPDPVTDIAITAVGAPSPVVQDDVVDVSVTVENVGNQAVADITVTLHSNNATPAKDDDFDIGSQTIAGGLAAGASTMLTFPWSTTSANIGDYILTASHNADADDDTNDSESTTVTVNEPTEGVTVTDIAPSEIGAGSTLVVTITGSGFAAEAEVTFENGSGPTPTASMVMVAADGESLTASVNAKSGGPPRGRVWDVRVTNPDNSSDVLVDGLTVTP